MDYIEKYRSSHLKNFCDDKEGSIREEFYKEARMDVGRAIIRGDMRVFGNVHDIIETCKKTRFTEEEKNYIVLSPKTKEEIAVELDCSVYYVAKIRREAKV